MQDPVDSEPSIAQLNLNDDRTTNAPSSTTEVPKEAICSTDKDSATLLLSKGMNVLCYTWFCLDMTWTNFFEGVVN